MSKGYVLITGATSGIGAAISEIFIKQGYPVLLTGRNVEKLEEFKKRFSSNVVETINTPICTAIMSQNKLTMNVKKAPTPGKKNKNPTVSISITRHKAHNNSQMAVGDIYNPSFIMYYPICSYYIV